MTARILIFVLMMAMPLSVLAEGQFPIYNGVLTTDLDGNGSSISTSGFTAHLSGSTDTATYQLDYWIIN